MLYKRNFSGRHLLTLKDFEKDEILYILEVSKHLKRMAYTGKKVFPVLRGKTLLLYFEKPSTRTRISLQTAMFDLGGNVINADPGALQVKRGETLADTARVLSRYVDGIAARVYSHKTLEELARYSDIPVINALSDMYHPLQALADALTIWEKMGRLEGVNVTFVGDGNNNVTHSLIIIGSRLGWNVKVICPKGYEPDKDVVNHAQEYFEKYGGSLVITNDLEEVRGSDVVYTDVWVSMGREEEKERRLKDFAPYQVNTELMNKAGKNAIFMHCLPAHRGEEVTNDVIDSARSVVFDQAENRYHTTKAVLALFL